MIEGDYCFNTVRISLRGADPLIDDGEGGPVQIAPTSELDHGRQGPADRIACDRSARLEGQTQIPSWKIRDASMMTLLVRYRLADRLLVRDGDERIVMA